MMRTATALQLTVLSMISRIITLYVIADITMTEKPTSTTSIQDTITPSGEGL